MAISCTSYRCDETRGCVMQFLPPDDKHVCSKHVEAWNKLTVKQKFCASSWLINEMHGQQNVKKSNEVWEGKKTILLVYWFSLCNADVLTGGECCSLARDHKVWQKKSNIIAWNEPCALCSLHVIALCHIVSTVVAKQYIHKSSGCPKSVSLWNI